MNAIDDQIQAVDADVEKNLNEVVDWVELQLEKAYRKESLKSVQFSS